jgi:hypothetical protein
MPGEVAQNKYGRGDFVAKYLRKQFKPLPLKDGLCEVCYQGLFK